MVKEIVWNAKKIPFHLFILYTPLVSDFFLFVQSMHIDLPLESIAGFIKQGIYGFLDSILLYLIGIGIL